MNICAFSLLSTPGLEDPNTVHQTVILLVHDDPTNSSVPFSKLLVTFSTVVLFFISVMLIVGLVSHSISAPVAIQISVTDSPSVMFLDLGDSSIPEWVYIMYYNSTVM